MQHFLKAFIGAARAWIVAAELFEEFFIAVYDAKPALDVRFGRIAATTLTGALESSVDRSRCFAWKTS
jgi:hypothetical protein